MSQLLGDGPKYRRVLLVLWHYLTYYICKYLQLIWVYLKLEIALFILSFEFIILNLFLLVVAHFCVLFAFILFILFLLFDFRLLLSSIYHLLEFLYLQTQIMFDFFSIIAFFCCFWSLQFLRLDRVVILIGWRKLY